MLVLVECITARPLDDCVKCLEMFQAAHRVPFYALNTFLYVSAIVVSMFELSFKCKSILYSSGSQRGGQSPLAGKNWIFGGP